MKKLTATSFTKLFALSCYMNDHQQTSLKLSSLSSDASASAIGQEHVSKFQVSVPSLKRRGSVSVADPVEGQKSPGGAGFKYHLLTQHRVSFFFFRKMKLPLLRL